MKSTQLINGFALAMLVPCMAFAQTHSVTRAEVKAQIVQAERAGTLHPSNTQYPLSVRRSTAIASRDTGYGASPQTNSQAGGNGNALPATAPSARSLGGFYDQR